MEDGLLSWKFAVSSPMLTRAERACLCFFLLMGGKQVSFVVSYILAVIEDS